MKNSEMSFNDFIDLCYQGKIRSKVEMYDFIKLKSNNFQNSILKYLVYDLRKYIYEIKIYFPRKQETIGGYYGIGEMNLPLKYDSITLKSSINLFQLNYSVEQVSELSMIEFEENQTLNERINILKSKLPKADFNYSKLNECDLSNLLILSEIIEEEYSNSSSSNTKPSYEEPSILSTTNNAKNKPKKEDLTFYQLFKNPYNKNLESFKKILQKNKFIDENYHWRTFDNNNNRLPINDIGKFYNWLYHETTVFDKKSNKTTHCICFCAEFGIIVYEGKINKPENGRIVTAKLIRESMFDNVLENNYKIHFCNWIDNV